MTIRQTILRTSFASQLALLAAAYVLLGAYEFLPGDVFAHPLSGPSVRPAAGLALGALLAFGSRLWPAVWIGAFAAAVSQTMPVLPVPTAFAVSAGVASAVAAQAWLGCFLIRKQNSDVMLDTGRDVFRCYLVGGLVTSLLSATIGSGILFAATETSPYAALVGWLSWWSGDTIGVMLVMPVVLAIAGSSALWRQRRLNVAIPLVIATFVMTFSFRLVDHLEQTNRQIEFEHRAETLFNAIRSAFTQAEEATGMLADFLRARPEADRDEFMRFSDGPLQRIPGIRALEWIPLVSQSELARHERSANLTNYRITEKGANGRRQPVSPRKEYFPVYFVHPLAGNEPALGYDLGSEPMRRNAIEHAWQTRQTSASAPIRLVQEEGASTGVLAFSPVVDPAGKLRGFGLYVISVTPYVEEALRRLPHDGIGLRLTDLDAPDDQKTLYAERNTASSPAAFRHESRFVFGDRQWQASFTPDSSYGFAQYAWHTWATLTCGVAISAMLACFLLILSGRSSRTRELVLERTAELDAARKRAENSNQLLHEAVDSIAQGFTIYDEQDRLVVCNEAYRQFYESSRDLIVPGATFEDIVRKGAERGQYADALGDIDTWVATRVALHQKADGRGIEQHLGDGRWLLIVEHRTPSGFIAGNRIDITANKRVEQALRESEMLANQIIEYAPDAMMLVDGSGNILKVNARAEEIFGYDRDELIGQPVELLIPGSQRVSHASAREIYAEAAYPTRMAQHREIFALHKNGSEIAIEISLAPIGTEGHRQFIVSVADITERKLVAAAIAERNAQLDAIFRLSPDGLLLFTPDDRIKYANPAFLHLAGMTQNEVSGIGIEELERRLREQIDRTMPWQGLATCFDADDFGTPFTTRRLLHLRRPREVVLEFFGAVSDHPSVGRLLYVRDVTHEVEVDRMKSEFLSHAAHELRTPMASIYGFTELLMTQEFDAETRRDMLGTIHRQTQWLVDIINELLDLARIESRRGQDFHIVEVELGPLVSETVQALQTDAERWPTSVSLSPTLPVVRADVAKLRQVLTNVLGNAIKYSPRGGAIDVCCIDHPDDAQHFVAIAVTDHGIGMTPQQTVRVGERFYRADTSGNIPGTGLGMAITKEVLDLLDGYMEVSSTLGQGTTITLWLPAGSAGPPSAPPTST